MRAIALGVALMVGLFAATQSQAQSLRSDRPHGEIALSDETLQLRHIDNGDQVDIGQGGRASGSFFLSESRAFAALLEDGNDDVLTLALGAEMRFELDRRTAGQVLRSRARRSMRRTSRPSAAPTTSATAAPASKSGCRKC